MAVIIATRYPERIEGGVKRDLGGGLWGVALSNPLPPSPPHSLPHATPPRRRCL